MSFWQTLYQELDDAKTLVVEDLVWTYYRLNPFDSKVFFASNNWSNRFTDQFYTNGKRLFLSSEANPIYKVTKMIIGDAIKKHGFDKVKEITGKVLGKAAFMAISYYTISNFTSFVARNIILDLKNSGFLSGILRGAGVKYAPLIGATVAYQFLKFEQAQVNSLCAFLSLKRQDVLLARRVFNANLDAFVFLAYRKYYEKILTGKI